jgi:Ca-activated chloride channel family protein
MAYGRPASVRSHRRSGRRRRRKSPVLAVVVTIGLLATGVVVGYTQLLAATCSGQETVRLMATPSIARHLDSFATEWATTEPATDDGTCARVIVESRGSAKVAEDLGTDPGAGEPPDVWVPASTAWAQKAAAADVAEPLIPDLLPSVARSPTVIAMPAPMAAALNWPDTQVEPDSNVRWESLLEEFAGDREGWARFDRPEWGQFRFGMSDPAVDTAGLLALTAILDSSPDGETSPEELANAFTLSQLVEPEVYHETTEQLLSQLAKADREGKQAALGYVSAFPALEQDVLEYNRGEPEVPLAAVYPVNGNIEADHPYLVLNADWVTAGKRDVAEDFLAYVRADESQAVLREAGFRGSQKREPGDALVEANGLVPDLVALPRAVLVPESVSLTIDRWTALTRRLNVLMVVDVSGSMLREIPGTGERRLDRARAAASGVVELFASDDQVGFWEFSTDLDGENDHRSLVPIGPIDDVQADGRSRRQWLLDEIGGLEAVADTGLYNTVQAAYDTVLANYEDEAINLVLVVTDGENDTGGRPGISLDDLRTHLRETAPEGQGVRVATVAFGDEAPFEVMQEISGLTGGEALYSEDGFDLVDVVRSAVFSSVS